MDIMEIMKARHSVRQYIDKPLEADVRSALEAEIEACNKEAGLHIQLVANEPKAFNSFMAHYGKFAGVSNYIALIGPSGTDLDELCGYYGERIVLKAQELGLNTCWVALTASKSTVKKNCSMAPGEKLACIIALGYGQTQGAPRRSKTFEEVARVEQPDDADYIQSAESNAQPAEASTQTTEANAQTAETSTLPAETAQIQSVEIRNGDGNCIPDWFRIGVEAALLAPTAVNQQEFLFILNGSDVIVKVAGIGFCTKLDIGIVRYHFEAATGRKVRAKS